jgi:hypothetical protein
MVSNLVQACQVVHFWGRILATWRFFFSENEKDTKIVILGVFFAIFRNKNIEISHI